MHSLGLPLALLGLSGQLPSVASMVIHESIQSVPFGWTESSKPADDTPMMLQVALAYQNMDELVSTASTHSEEPSLTPYRLVVSMRAPPQVTATANS